MRALNGIVARNRSLAALLGTLLVLATAGFAVHSAICGCDDVECVACVCVAAGAVATLVSRRWGPSRSRVGPLRFLAMKPASAYAAPVLDPLALLARAGPGPPDILRL
ncbi:MAG TPA: hypothetical protein VNV44_00235 [Solirubrobacteraceae bacterium]|nr:hypothetical protein [Solirubrobacteraceae bacterium]